MLDFSFSSKQKMTAFYLGVLKQKWYETGIRLNVGIFDEINGCSTS